MTDPWGIADGYHDALGAWRVLSPATREALRRAMGAEGDAPPPAPVIVGRAGERVDIRRPRGSSSKTARLSTSTARFPSTSRPATTSSSRATMGRRSG